MRGRREEIRKITTRVNSAFHCSPSVEGSQCLCVELLLVAQGQQETLCCPWGEGRA